MAAFYYLSTLESNIQMKQIKYPDFKYRHSTYIFGFYSPIQKINDIFLQDTADRMEFCEQMMDTCNDNNFFRHILFYSESIFPLYEKQSCSEPLLC